MRVIFHLQYLLIAVQSCPVSHSLRQSSRILTSNRRVEGLALTGELIPTSQGKFLMICHPESLHRQLRNSLLHHLRPLITQQQSLHLRLPIPLLTLNVLLEDVVVVSQTHLPECIYVIFEQLLLLGVRDHKKALN